MSTSGKPRILFLNHAPTPEHHQDMLELFEMSFMGSLLETGQVEYKSFWFKAWLSVQGEFQDQQLLREAISYRPDIICVYAWWYHTDQQAAGMVSIVTLYLLRKLLGVRIVAYLFDQYCEHFYTTDILLALCDMAFIHEHRKYYQDFTQFPERHIKTIATVSPALFHGNPLSNRSIPISFVGGVGGYSNGERSQGLEQLRLNKVPVVTPGGRGTGQKKISNSEYAWYFRNSRISLCWTKHISGHWYQAKGRIFEATLAGSMLLCEGCEEVDEYFRPFIDYIPFHGEQDLVIKAKHYLQNNDERLKVAVSGNKVAFDRYRADVVWGHDATKDARLKLLFRG